MFKIHLPLCMKSFISRFILFVTQVRLEIKKQEIWKEVETSSAVKDSKWRSWCFLRGSLDYSVIKVFWCNFWPFTYRISTSQLAEDMLYNCTLRKKRCSFWYYLSLKIKPEFFSFHVTQFFVVYFIINFNLWKVQGISFILLDKIGKTLFSTSMPNSTTNTPVLSFYLRCWNPNHLTK